jgi:toxin ParE1/3/4
MACAVSIVPRAEKDLARIYAYTNAATSDVAYAWYVGPVEQMFTLKNSPLRNPSTPEDPKYRHLPYGKKPDVYRVIYRVIDSTKLVEILTIRHGARAPFKPEAM